MERNQIDEIYKTIKLRLRGIRQGSKWDDHDEILTQVGLLERDLKQLRELIEIESR